MWTLPNRPTNRRSLRAPTAYPMQVVQPPADRLPGALRTHQREVAAAAALSSSGVIAALLYEFTEPGMMVTVVSQGGDHKCDAPAGYLLLLRRAAAAAAAHGLPCSPNFILFPLLPPQWELVEGMDLLDYLNSRGGVLAEAEAAPLFAQLVHGIRLIHEAGLVHRGAACCGGNSCQCPSCIRACCVHAVHAAHPAVASSLPPTAPQPPTRCPCPAASIALRRCEG